MMSPLANILLCALAPPIFLFHTVGSSGRMDADVVKRVAQASKAFGALRKPVFLDRSLSLATKRKLYNACVLSVLRTLWC